MSSAVMTEKRTVADAYVRSLAAKDFDALAECFAPHVRFRALTPNHVWAHMGPVSAIETLRDWFGDQVDFALQSSWVEEIADVVRISYRFHARAETGLEQVEQQAYCRMSGGQIADIAIICTGYWPAAS